MPQKAKPGPVFLVERYMPGVTESDLSTIVSAAVLAARSMSADDHDVRYLASTLIPLDEVVLCLFEAESAHDVAEVNRLADVPFDRIVPAIRLMIPPWNQGPEPLEAAIES